jgi:hypothetical protein
VKREMNSVLAAVTLGRNAIRSLASAMAGNPPSLSAILMSAVLGYIAHLLHARPALSSALRLE